MPPATPFLLVLAPFVLFGYLVVLAFTWAALSSQAGTRGLVMPSI